MCWRKAVNSKDKKLLPGWLITAQVAQASRKRLSIVIYQ